MSRKSSDSGEGLAVSLFASEANVSFKRLNEDLKSEMKRRAEEIMHFFFLGDSFMVLIFGGGK